MQYVTDKCRQPTLRAGNYDLRQWGTRPCFNGMILVILSSITIRQDMRCPHGSVSNVFYYAEQPFNHEQQAPCCNLCP